MAVGETSGQSGPRRLITAGGGRRRAEDFAEVDEEETTANGTVEAEELTLETADPADTAADTEVADVVEVVEAPEAGEAAPEAAEVAEVVEGEGDEEAEAPVVSDLLPQPSEPDDLERQLARDEEMERQSRHEHHEAPHFRKESD
jgi:hypothetical protein